ncbi:hypothetical protein [Streptomyces sp. RG80]|uniref:hypothetical protein n=1 Tax=Streptomyces sp. RG80 TaxID=3157340 RepID=UPI00338FBBFD
MPTTSFKLYLLNGAEAVLGHYMLYMRNVVLEDGREIERVLDVSGAGVGLAHHVTDENPNSQGTVFVNSFQEWFDAIWEHLTD